MLQSVDRLTIDKLHAAARRERAEYVHSIVRGAFVWLCALVARLAHSPEPYCA